MAGDIPDIDPGDGGGVDETAKRKPAAAISPTGERCISCDAEIVGPYCAICGQKDDDMRRSSFVLFKDFVEDTFAFDSRMWRTLGLMASAPGLVPKNYSHGKRSRYTPPVRLFLVVSFLFFLVLGLTHTMFVAVEVTAKSAEQIARDKAEYEKTMDRLGPEERAEIEDLSDEKQAFVVDEDTLDCNINVSFRFFVRPQDVKFDEEHWRACAQSFANAASDNIDDGESSEKTKSFRAGFDRVVSGVNQMVSNPTTFNAGINTWLPRVMFFMTPVLALILAMFIRGKDALLFDHLVLSLYSHAAGFAVIGAAIVLAQLGAPNMFPISFALLGVYSIVALRRAYRRGWVKTIFTSLFAGFIYAIILVSAVVAIITSQIWTAAA